MFQLTWDEVQALRSQFVILKKLDPNSGKQGRHLKFRPYAFTEQGIAMLSSVLRSKCAIQVNISIMRAFVRLRKILSTHKELADKLNELAGKVEKHDKEIQAIFDAIRKLIAPPPVEEKPKPKIGFHPHV